MNEQAIVNKQEEENNQYHQEKNNQHLQEEYQQLPNNLKFEKIPNEIIDYSIQYNHHSLLIYLYMLMNKSSNNKVIVTLDTIKYLYDYLTDTKWNKTNRNKDYLDGLNQLCKNITYEELNLKPSNENENNIFLHQSIEILEYIEDLNLFFLKINNYSNILNNFTVIEYKEYEYLVQCCQLLNKKYINSKTNSKINTKNNTVTNTLINTTEEKTKIKKLNSALLFNIYFYLKKTITRNNFFQNNTYLAYSRLSKICSISNNTLQTYLNLLEDLNLIKIIRTKNHNKEEHLITSDNKSNKSNKSRTYINNTTQFKLNEKWREYYK